MLGTLFKIKKISVWYNRSPSAIDNSRSLFSQIENYFMNDDKVLYVSDRHLIVIVLVTSVTCTQFLQKILKFWWAWIYAFIYKLL